MKTIDHVRCADRSYCHNRDDDNEIRSPADGLSTVTAAEQLKSCLHVTQPLRISWPFLFLVDKPLTNTYAQTYTHTHMHKHTCTRRAYPVFQCCPRKSWGIRLLACTHTCTSTWSTTILIYEEAIEIHQLIIIIMTSTAIIPCGCRAERWKASKRVKIEHVLVLEEL